MSEDHVAERKRPGSSRGASTDAGSYEDEFVILGPSVKVKRSVLKEYAREHGILEEYRREIEEDLYDKLMRYREYYSSSDVVFENPQGKPLSSNTLRRYCYEAAEATGDQDLIDNLSPHSLRHYRTVELSRNDFKDEAIRRFLGHASLDTTQRYLKGDKDMLLEEMEEKDNRYSEGGETE
ncbi:MAG: tyrosine-type recombinase/integrase [Candidatus Natronoplasma sp.]